MFAGNKGYSLLETDPTPGTSGKRKNEVDDSDEDSRSSNPPSDNEPGESSRSASGDKTRGTRPEIEIQSTNSPSDNEAGESSRSPSGDETRGTGPETEIQSTNSPSDNEAGESSRSASGDKTRGTGPEIETRSTNLPSDNEAGESSRSPSGDETRGTGPEIETRSTNLPSDNEAGESSRSASGDKTRGTGPEIEIQSTNLPSNNEAGESSRSPSGGEARDVVPEIEIQSPTSEEFSSGMSSQSANINPPDPENDVNMPADDSGTRRVQFDCTKRVYEFCQRSFDSSDSTKSECLSCIEIFCSYHGYVCILLIAAILYTGHLSDLEKQRGSFSYINTETPIDLNRDVCTEERNVSTSDCLLENEIIPNRKDFVRYVCKSTLWHIFKNQLCGSGKNKSNQFPVIDGQLFFNKLSGNGLINTANLIQYKSCVLAFKNNPFGDVLVIPNSRGTLEFRYDFIYKNYGLMRSCRYISSESSPTPFLRDPKNLNFIIQWSCLVSFIVVTFLDHVWYRVIKPEMKKFRAKMKRQGTTREPLLPSSSQETTV